MMNKEIIVDGVDVSEWTDEEVRYKFEKHSPKAIRQIAFDLYKQLKRKEQECEEINLKNERLVAEKYTMNEEILKFRQALDEIEKYLDAQQKYFDGEDYHNLLDIINKVKEEINEES